MGTQSKRLCIWGGLRIQEWVASKHHTVRVKADRFYPASQTCSRCGALNHEMKDLGKRTFECGACSLEIDRDLNATINLKDEGLRIIKGLSEV